MSYEGFFSRAEGCRVEVHGCLKEPFNCGVACGIMGRARTLKLNYLQCSPGIDFIPLLFNIETAVLASPWAVLDLNDVQYINHAECSGCCLDISRLCLCSSHSAWETPLEFFPIGNFGSSHRDLTWLSISTHREILKKQ